jgi:hypothetical protein
VVRQIPYAAFKNQFRTEPGVPLNPGAKGYAAPKKGTKASSSRVNSIHKPGKTKIVNLSGRGYTRGGIGGSGMLATK